MGHVTMSLTEMTKECWNCIDKGTQVSWLQLPGHLDPGSLDGRVVHCRVQPTTYPVLKGVIMGNRQEQVAGQSLCPLSPPMPLLPLLFKRRGRGIKGWRGLFTYPFPNKRLLFRKKEKLLGLINPQVLYILNI